MLPGKHKIRGFPLVEDLMSSVSKITLSEICVLFQVAVINFVMLCKCLINELRINSVLKFRFFVLIKKTINHVMLKLFNTLSLTSFKYKFPI